MSLTQVSQPYPVFTDVNGDPLDAGYVYIGQPNQNPETNPVAVFWDPALTLPIAQPIRTINGYASRNGTPSPIYANVEIGQYSIAVKNRKHVVVFTSPVGNYYYVTYADAANVTFTPAGSTNESTVAVALNGFVNVVTWGADPTGVADSTLAINRATKYVADVLGGGAVYYPAGNYRITRAIRLDDYDIETFTYSGNPRMNVAHIGSGRDSTRIFSDGFWTSIFTSFPEPFLSSGDQQPALKEPGQPGANEYVFVAQNIVITGMTLDGDYDSNVDGGAAYGSNYATWGGVWPDGSTGPSTWAADNYQYPVYAYNVSGLHIHNCRIKRSWFNGIEIYRCHDVQIDHNIVENCGDKANHLGYYSGCEFDNGSLRCNFDNNYVKSCGTGVMSNGDTLPYVWRAVTQVSVSNNIFDTMVNAGIYAFDWLNDWIVSDNIFYNINGGAILFALNATPVVGRQPAFVKISDNMIHGFNNANGDAQTAIRAHGSGFTVTGNTVFQYNAGITGRTSAIVIGNGAVTPPSGSEQVCLVANNMISGYFPGTDQNSQIINCGAPKAHIVNNLISAMGSSAWVAIGIAGDDSHVEGNSIVGTFNYVSGGRSVYWAGGQRPYINDNRSSPFLDIYTTVDRPALTGWNDVDFVNYTPVKVDVRNNFNNGVGNAFVADVPGLYEFSVTAIFSSGGTPAAPIAVLSLVERNGATYMSSSIGLSPGNLTLTYFGIVELNNGDYIKMRMYGASAFTQGIGTHLNVKFLKSRS